MDLRVRPAREDDLMLVFEWANDPVTRKMSFSQEPITLETHERWFCDMLAGRDARLMIVEGFDSEVWRPVGQVQVDKHGEIGVLLAAEFRGRGLAAAVITTALHDIEREYPLTRVIAHVKPDNVPSSRAFERAGFRLTGEAIVKGHRCLEYVYELPARQAPASEQGVK